MGKVFEIKKDLKGLAAFRKERPQKARAIMDRGAKVIEQRQKELCPKDTGALSASIHIENRGTFEIAIVEGNDQINYGLYVEFGTEKMAAQPHARPAAMEGVRYVEGELRKLARE